MPNLGCSVCDCNHNSQGLCSLNDINVSGGASKENTCCASFSNSSSTTNCCKDASPTTDVACKAHDCSHNEDCHCKADSIDICSCGSNCSCDKDTECSSFNHK